jgi:hypothetical protein
MKELLAPFKLPAVAGERAPEFSVDFALQANPRSPRMDSLLRQLPEEELPRTLLANGAVNQLATQRHMPEEVARLDRIILDQRTMVRAGGVVYRLDLLHDKRIRSYDSCTQAFWQLPVRPS